MILPRPDEAVEQFRISWESRVEGVGVNHIVSRITQFRLCEVLALVGRNEEAITIFSKYPAVAPEHNRFVSLEAKSHSLRTASLFAKQESDPFALGILNELSESSELKNDELEQFDWFGLPDRNADAIRKIQHRCK